MELLRICEADCVSVRGKLGDEKFFNAVLQGEKDGNDIEKGSDYYVYGQP